MAYTIDQLQTMVEAIDTQLDALTASNITTYKIGNATFNKADWSKFLMKRRDRLQGLIESFSKELINSVDLDITRFGEDDSVYDGDNT